MSLDRNIPKITFLPHSVDGYALVKFKDDPNDYFYVRSDKLDTFIVNEKIKEIDIHEEDKMLNRLGYDDKQKDIYSKDLIRLGFKSGYKIYKTTDIPLPKKDKIYEEINNSNKLTLYVILRNDINRNVGLQMSDVVDMTRVIQEDLRNKALTSDMYKEWYYDFVNMDTNVVILQASGKDLFEDNFIPSEYDNPKIIFNYIWENEKRVAHGNFRLIEGVTVCLGYFGYKKDMPKFVKNLKLYGE